MKTLIIAEKPSVAKDIAKALGGFQQASRDYFERADLIVSSAVGHLCQVDVPEAQNYPPLPIIPAQFSIVPIEKAKPRLHMLRDLIKRPDVTRVVNCCDAGREGELIFHLLYAYIGANKPTYRMWMQSMTADSIRMAYNAIEPGENYRRLLDAALCRTEADWLIGINGSRALARLLRKAIGDAQVSSVGRVQTPTLALMVHRELEITHFKPRDYFEIHGRFRTQAGEYAGKWQRNARSRSEDDQDARFQIATQQAAQEILDKCRRATTIRIEEESKPVLKSAPGLFDLTTLQREANKRFGFSAMETLKLAQALYETHKVTSYPRTDSSALPEDYLGTVERIMKDFTGTPYNGYSAIVLDNGWIKPNKKIFNNEKISDHFAIIPTGQQPSNLSDAESKIYDLVVRRFIGVFFPAAEYLKTTRITFVGDEEFYSMGNVLKAPGWQQVYGSHVDPESESAEAALTAVAPGEAVTLAAAEIKALKTKPPKRYNEATLLSAMEHASGDITDDDDARKAMSEKGLGTPATRAAIIEGLIDKNYVGRDGKQLKPTERAMFLVPLLEKIGLGLLTSAKTTGEWEHKLALMDKGQYHRPSFMAEIGETTRLITAHFARHEASVRPAYPCPDCGSALIRYESKHKKGDFYWSCSGEECKTKFTDAKGKPGQKKVPGEVSTEHFCPACGKGLIRRKGIHKKTAQPYQYWTCSGFPECKAEPLKDAGGQPVFED